MWALEWLHDMWLVACILLVAGCSAPAFQCLLIARCLLVVARVLVPVFRHGEAAFAVRAASVLVDGVSRNVVVCDCLLVFVVVVAVGCCYCCFCCCCWWLSLCLWLVSLAMVDTALWFCFRLERRTFQSQSRRSRQRPS